MTLRFDAPVLLVGGGPTDCETFQNASEFTSAVIAVDSGADHLRGWGARADAVIGDMDSVRAAPDDGTEVIHIEEQDSTDLEKTLDGIDAPLFIGVGFLGGRLDHTLASMHALVRFADTPVILVGDEDIAFASPREWTAQLAPGERVSFFPVKPVKATGSTGLYWPLEGLAMEAGSQIGTSNEAVTATVSASFASPGAVTILARRWLAAVVESLA